MKPIDTELLDTIVENTDMGMHNMDVLLETTHLKNEEFRKALQEQYENYKKINNQAADYLKNAGEDVKEGGNAAKEVTELADELLHIHRKNTDAIRASL